MIELLLAEHGAQPTGHGWSRDGAEEAALELGALARFLAPDARPLLRTWHRGEAGVWQALDRPLVGSTWRWDAEAGVLTTQVDGVRVEAAPEGRSWRIRLQGKAAVKVGDAWVAGAAAIGAPGHVALDLTPGRLTDSLAVGCLTDGLPDDIAATATLVGPDARIDLGTGASDGAGWRWAVAERPAPPWGVVVQLAIVMPGTTAPWEGALPVVEPCHLADPRVDDGRIVHPGDRLVSLGFRAATMTPSRARLRLRCGPWSAEVEGHHVGDGTYALEPTVRLPDTLPSPATLVVTADGQDAPAGALIVAPIRVSGRWRLVRDARGDAKRPAVGPEQLALTGVPDGWTPAPGPDARFVIDGEPVRVPIDDDRPTLELEEPGRGLVDGAWVSGLAAGLLTCWLPGLPPIEVPVDAAGRLRPRGSSLRELATVAGARGMALRIGQGTLRGLVYPGQVRALTELTPDDDAWPLPDGQPLWVVWSGVGFAARRAGASVELDLPLPCDGRLGADVPVPARVSADGDALIVAIDLARYALRRKGAAWTRQDGSALSRDARGDLALGGVWLREAARGWGFTGWCLGPDGRLPVTPGLRVFATAT